MVPLLHGPGTKRKLLQALMAGTPTVSTSVGTEGFGLTDGEHVLVADDADAFASAIERLLTDDPLWRRLAAQGRAHVESVYSREAVRARFLATISSVLGKSAKRSVTTLESDARPPRTGLTNASSSRFESASARWYRSMPRLP